MERRIRVVWGLSILAMLLITIGQGYWLVNQYRYVNDERVHELYNDILKIAKLNDSIRSLKPEGVLDKGHAFYNINMSQQGPNKIVNTLVLGAVSLKDSTMESSHSRIEKHIDLGKMVDSIRRSSSNDSWNRYIATHKVLYKDSFQIAAPTFAAVNLNQLVELYRLEVNSPFSLQHFDSLLALRVKDIPFTTRLERSKDTAFQWEPEMKQTFKLLYSRLEVRYPYNPLKHQFLVVDVDVMPHVLLVRMGWQLLGSVCLIMLLGLCLWLQIKTILKQKRIDELRKSFVNTMIHELKRPVQALKMCVAFLNDKILRTDEKAMDEVIRDSMSELDNLSAYLSKLRDMTRADDEHTQLVIRTFDLKEVVEKLLRLCHIVDGKQVSVETHYNENLLVTADPIHIANMISNLIENSIKYSEESVHITINCDLCDHLLTLRVADDGIGVPVAEQGRVFDKFYRASNVGGRSLPGIGLGLSYVKLLVEAHHGTISLVSQPGRGTEVSICIPQ